MKKVLAAMCGCMIGILAGYYLIPYKPEVLGIVSVKPLASFHRVSGFVEAVDIRERYFLFSIVEDYTRASRHTVKIHFTQNIRIGERIHYVSDDSRYFEELKGSSKTINDIAIGNRLNIKFTYSPETKRFEAESIGIYSQVDRNSQ